MPVAASGPLFVTFAVYVTSLPVSIGSGSSVSSVTRSDSVIVIASSQQKRVPAIELPAVSLTSSVQSPPACWLSNADRELSGR